MTLLGQQFTVDMFEAQISAESAAATGALMGDLMDSVFKKMLGVNVAKGTD